jgi:glutamate formiminotransferase/formiminotetrahydrofolate cyclodeaminase
VVKDAEGNDVRIPGTLKACKAIGWYIEEYGIAQISMNLTNYKITSVHMAFDEVCKSAERRGMRVTGSELVGLIPLDAMLTAGRHYLQKQNRSLGVSEAELIEIAIKSLGLNELTPFDPQQKIIEYKLQQASQARLIKMNLVAFANETASESPAPGGGSISAYVGSLGVALGTMVANLSAGKRGWEDQFTFFSDWAQKGQAIKDKLLAAVDEDTAAFNKIMEAFGLPKNTAEEKLVRTEAIENATKYACEVPFAVMQTSYDSLEMLSLMVEKGNQNSITDAGVGVLCVKTAVRGAYFNVMINAKGLKDQAFAQEITHRAKALLAKNHQESDRILALVEAALV